MQRRKMVVGAVGGVVLALCGVGLSALVIRELLWRIAAVAGGDEVGAIFRQLQEAKLAFPWLLVIVCAAVMGVLLGIALRYGGWRRAVSVSAVGVTCLLSLLLILLDTSVNGVPLYTAVQVVLELLQAGVL